MIFTRLKDVQDFFIEYNHGNLDNLVKISVQTTIAL